MTKSVHTIPTVFQWETYRDISIQVPNNIIGQEVIPDRTNPSN